MQTGADIMHFPVNDNVKHAANFAAVNCYCGENLDLLLDEFNPD